MKRSLKNIAGFFGGYHRRISHVALRTPQNPGRHASCGRCFNRQLFWTGFFFPTPTISFAVYSQALRVDVNWICMVPVCTCQQGEMRGPNP